VDDVPSRGCDLHDADCRRTGMGAAGVIGDVGRSGLDLSSVPTRFVASCNGYQLSSVRSASTQPRRPCRLMPASSSTARAAASGSSLRPAIAVCSAHTARCRARRSSRTGSAVEVASFRAADLILDRQQRTPRRRPRCRHVRIAGRRRKLVRRDDVDASISRATTRVQRRRCR
jgi:hypothetical protein